jgi:hypothetical protein
MFNTIKKLFARKTTTTETEVQYPIFNIQELSVTTHNIVVSQGIFFYTLDFSNKRWIDLDDYDTKPLNAFDGCKILSQYDDEELCIKVSE